MPSGTPAPSVADAAYDGTLARLYARVGRVADADRLYTRLLDDPSAQAADVASAAVFFERRGQPAKASAAIDRLDKVEAEPGLGRVMRAGFEEHFGSDERAAALYAAAAAAAPKNAAYWRALAGYHLRHGRTAEADAAAEQGLKSSPDDADLKAMRQRVATVRSLKSPREAQPIIALVAENPQSVPAAEMLQVVADAQAAPPAPGRAARSSVKFREVADKHPDFLPAQEWVIETELATGHADRAAAFASRAAQAFPYDPEPARLLVNAYQAAGRWGKMLDAAAAWRQRSAADPLPADVAAAEALLGQGRPREAVYRLAPYVKQGPPVFPPPAPPPTARSRWPSGTRCSAARTLALIGAGRAGDAKKMLGPLLPQSADARLVWLTLAPAHPDEPAAAAWVEQVVPFLAKDSVVERYALAEAWHEVGKSRHAPAALRMAREVVASMIEHAEAGPAVWDLMARNALESGDYAEAERGWRKAKDLGQKDPAVLNNLAYVLLARGDKAALAEARDFAEAAVAASPETASFHDTLARVYAQTARRDLAVKSFRQALANDPESVEAMIGLADQLSRGSDKGVDPKELAEARALLARVNRALDGSAGASSLPAVQKQLDGLRTALLQPLGDGGR